MTSRQQQEDASKKEVDSADHKAATNTSATSTSRHWLAEMEASTTASLFDVTSTGPRTGYDGGNNEEEQ